jgi:glycosyltransferase involved in cell wall biosynthesis
MRVNRGDGTYIDFVDSFADVYTESDIQTLRMNDFCLEDGKTAKRPAAEVAKIIPDFDPGINWFSPILGVADGYGNSAEHIIREVSKSARVSIEPNYQMSSQQTLIGDVLEQSFQRANVRVAYCPPHVQHWTRKAPGQAVLGFTMWEDSVVPPAWAEAFSVVDAVATCSRFCVDLFEAFIKDLGLSTPVVYVPLGVDGDFYCYQRRSFKKGNDDFRVLHSSTSIYDGRKGAVEAYQAFLKAFGNQRDVRLVFRTRFGNLDITDSRIEYLTGSITEEEKRDILYGSHTLLYPSHGEGFGLIPLEAIASGLPTICSANSAMLDYQDLYYPVECSPSPSRISTAFQVSSSGVWWKPDVAIAAKRLRYIYEHYQQATTFAAQSAKNARSQWGYDRSATALLEALDVARASYAAKVNHVPYKPRELRHAS